MAAKARDLAAAGLVIAVTWGLAAALILIQDEKVVLTILRGIIAVSLAAVGALAAASILYARG